MNTLETHPLLQVLRSGTTIIFDTSDKWIRRHFLVYTSKFCQFPFYLSWRMVNCGQRDKILFLSVNVRGTMFHGRGTWLRYRLKGGQIWFRKSNSTLFVPTFFCQSIVIRSLSMVWPRNLQMVAPLLDCRTNCFHCSKPRKFKDKSM